MPLPNTLYVLQMPDGSLRAYEKESEVGAPTDTFASMGTYTLVKTENVKRQIITVLDKQVVPRSI